MLTSTTHPQRHAMWQISGQCGKALPQKLFSNRCSICFVDPVCFCQKCNSITQVGVVVLLWSRIDWDHSLCRRWLGLAICEKGLVMLCLLESESRLTWLLRCRDLSFRGVFFFCWTLSCKENTKLPTIDLVVSFCSRRVKVYRFTSSEMCCLTNYSEESFTEGSWIMRVFMWSKLETQ